MAVGAAGDGTMKRRRRRRRRRMNNEERVRLKMKKKSKKKYDSKSDAPEIKENRSIVTTADETETKLFFFVFFFEFSCRLLHFRQKKSEDKRMKIKNVLTKKKGNQRTMTKHRRSFFELRTRLFDARFDVIKMN